MILSKEQYFIELIQSIFHEYKKKSNYQMQFDKRKTMFNDIKTTIKNLNNDILKNEERDPKK